jgi:general secretion pathway protein A
MYEKFFNFREKPFKLVPNPAYLFLSKSHEETLAHLNYSLAEGDGFVEITGEVGTGKTTLCRAFLENLDANTTAAYIFNPRLGPKQLIRTINDELGIKYDSDNTKDIIDKLNSYLIRKKAQQKRIILLIDEAQNLSRTVLEQLRLLSNLETNKEKLLQIILVGQPELSDLIDSHELRQLSQRITLRYRLAPLNSREMVAYIKYRISIAAQKPGIKFSRAAFRRIYRYSRGIPRVINILCDRSLLTAFSLNRHKITGSIVRASIKELKGHTVTRKFDLTGWNKAFITIAILCGLLATALFHQPLFEGIASYFNQSQSSEVEKSTIGEPAPIDEITENSQEPGVSDWDNSPATYPNAPGISELTTPGTSEGDRSLDSDSPPDPAAQQSSLLKEQAPNGKKTVTLADHLAAMDIGSSRHIALKNALGLWQTPIEFKPYLDNLDDDQAFFRLTAKPGGIFIHRIKTDLSLLRRLDLPAILEFFPASSEAPGYLTLSKTEGEKIIFDGPLGDKEIETNEAQVNLYWSGVAYLPWKDFLSIWGTLPTRTNKDSIITLKLLLHDLGYLDVELNDDYDSRTRAVIEEIQSKHGILSDGIVGPLTKIILYRLEGSFDMPRLREK